MGAWRKQESSGPAWQGGRLLQGAGGPLAYGNMDRALPDLPFSDDAVNKILGWPIRSFGFFCNILGKIPNKLIGQPSKRRGCNFCPED